jgi:Ca-activated chloride channel family protein
MSHQIVRIRAVPVATLILLTVGFCAAGQREASAAQVRLDVGVSNPTMLAGQKGINHVRISLQGFELPGSKHRPPVNVAIVIDNSGSMSGQKIAQARDAAIAAVKRLRDDDIVSVVLYNSSVEVIVPATKATDRAQIIKKIKQVTAGGSTALFAGVSKGAAEVRKFRESESVNRVILLSDGRANVGPKSPRELERLGASLVKEGISVTTLGLGLGYNEDLMSRLAAAGSGNHMFVEQADDLIAVFNNEFNDLMSVVASDFEIVAHVAAGVRPVRVLGTKADISGQEVSIPLAQLYSRQERYFVLEVEVDAGNQGSSKNLVSVSVEYQNMVTETVDKLTSSVSVRFSDKVADIERDRDVKTYAFCVIQLANERNCRATELRDAGQVEEAEKLLLFNGKTLSAAAAVCKENNVEFIVPELERNVRLNVMQAAKVTLFDDQIWNETRKAMRAAQNENAAQQTYRSEVPKSDR